MNKALSQIVSPDQAESFLRQHADQAMKQIGEMVQRCGLSIEDKEDLVSDILLELLNGKIQKYDGSSKISTWIGVVTRQSLLNRYKLVKRAKKGEMNELNQPYHEDSPDRIAMARELMEQIQNESDPRLRTMLQGRFIHSLTLSEIAQQINASVSAVHWTLREWTERKKVEFGLEESAVA